jgi:hypothetical protein
MSGTEQTSRRILRFIKPTVRTRWERGCVMVLIPLDVAHHSGMISPAVPI